jgi:hypothetical protein
MISNLSVYPANDSLPRLLAIAEAMPPGPGWRLDLFWPI